MRSWVRRAASDGSTEMPSAGASVSTSRMTGRPASSGITHRCRSASRNRVRMYSEGSRARSCPRRSSSSCRVCVSITKTPLPPVPTNSRLPEIRSGTSRIWLIYWFESGRRASCRSKRAKVLWSASKRSRPLAVPTQRAPALSSRKACTESLLMAFGFSRSWWKASKAMPSKRTSPPSVQIHTMPPRSWQIWLICELGSPFSGVYSRAVCARAPRAPAQRTRGRINA